MCRGNVLITDRIDRALEAETKFITPYIYRAISGQQYMIVILIYTSDIYVMRICRLGTIISLECKKMHWSDLVHTLSSLLWCIAGLHYSYGFICT